MISILIFFSKRNVITHLTSGLLHPHLLLHLNHLHLLLIGHSPRNPNQKRTRTKDPQPLPRKPKTRLHPRSRVADGRGNEAALCRWEDILEGDDAVVEGFRGEVVVVRLGGGFRGF